MKKKWKYFFFLVNFEFRACVWLLWSCIFVDETEDETYFSATEIWITILYIPCVIMMMFCSFMCNRKSNFCIRCNISKNSLMCEMKELVGEEVESSFLRIMDKRKRGWINERIIMRNDRWNSVFFGKECCKYFMGKDWIVLRDFGLFLGYIVGLSLSIIMR